MPVDDLLQRVAVAELYPAFVVRLRALLEECRSRGADYWVTSGHRSIAEQDRRYRAYITGQGTKANAPGGSGHNFGLAVDVVQDADKDKPGLQADYADKAYAMLGVLCPRFGLKWGGTFHEHPDSPHVQWPDYVSGSLLRGVLLPIYSKTPGDEAAKLRGVWAHLDGRTKP